MQSKILEEACYAISTLAGLALGFLVLAWGIGGSEFARDVLLRDTSLPILIALALPGVVFASLRYLGGKY